MLRGFTVSCSVVSWCECCHGEGTVFVFSLSDPSITHIRLVCIAATVPMQEIACCCDYRDALCDKAFHLFPLSLCLLSPGCLEALTDGLTLYSSFLSRGWSSALLCLCFWITWDHLGSTLWTPPLPPLVKSIASVFLHLFSLLTSSGESGEDQSFLKQTYAQISLCSVVRRFYLQNAEFKKITQPGVDNLSIHRGASFVWYNPAGAGMKWLQSIPLVNGITLDFKAHSCRMNGSRFLQDVHRNSERAQEESSSVLPEGLLHH